jgi:hypothetical protein
MQSFVNFGVIKGTVSLAVTGNVAIASAFNESFIAVDFGGGGATNFNIGGTVTLTTQGGQSVSDFLADTTGSWTSGGITINNGNGGSVITLGDGSVGSIQINGNLTITNGVGNDAFTARGASTQISGKVTINNGIGDTNDRFQAANMTTIGGNLSVTNLDGFDNFSLTSSTFSVGGILTLNDGTGGASISLLPGASGTITGGLAILAGGDLADNLRLANLSVGGTDRITTGTGNDSINIDRSTFGAMTIGTGAGADLLRIATGNTGFTGTATTFNGAVNVVMGTGDDSVFLGTPASSTDFVQFKTAPVSINGGDGVSPDSIDFDLLFAFAAYGANNVFPAGQPTVKGFETVE